MSEIPKTEESPFTAAAPDAPPVAPTPAPATPAAKTPGQIVKVDSAYQDVATGEMWVPASDQSGKLIPTGQYFEVVTQSLPSVENMEGPRTPGIRIRPWAFAKSDTAQALVYELKPYLPNDVALSIENADENTQFPYSHPQRQIAGKRGEKKARINAGMLASNIARSTALLDGQIKQFPVPCLQGAAAEIMLQLDHVDE